MNIGEASSLSPEPSLLQLHDPIQISGKDFLPIGKIRYAYGRGFWEEWFLTNNQNQKFWLSVDEGDFVLQQKSNITLPFKNLSAVNVGRKYGKYVVTEKGTGKCVGFEGELPQTLKLGESHLYLHLSQGEGKLLTLENDGTENQTFEGEWIDPLTIKRVFS